MKYEVYHAIDPTFMDSRVRQFPSEFEKVAEVEVPKEFEEWGKEFVFKHTNHIDSDWTKNPQVVMFKAGGVRSTSVGDMIVDENSDVFLCLSAGWKHYGSMFEI